MAEFAEISAWIGTANVVFWDSIVTSYKKTRHMGFFVNIEIAIYIDYITLGLTVLQIWAVLEIQRLSKLFSDARTIELENLRCICVATYARIVSIYYAYTLIDFLLMMGRAVRTNETVERFSTKPPRKLATSCLSTESKPVY